MSKKVVQSPPSNPDDGTAGTSQYSPGLPLRTPLFRFLGLLGPSRGIAWHTGAGIVEDVWRNPVSSFPITLLFFIAYLHHHC